MDEPCTKNSAACAVTAGSVRGLCHDTDGEGPSPLKCHENMRDPRSCAPGEYAGYQNIEDRDYSMGFCFDVPKTLTGR